MAASPATNSEIKQCLHCDLAVPSDRGEDNFCCSGCSFVYKTIHDSGLENFYAYKQNLNESLAKPAPEPNKNYGFFDSKEYIDKYVVDKNSSISKTTFFIDGIHCAACVWLLEKLPQVLDKVTSARVNFKDQTLSLEYHAKEIKLSEIAKAISSFGYQASPPDINKDAHLIKNRRNELLRIGIAGLCAGNTMLLAVSLYQGLYTGIPKDYQNFLQWISFLISIPAVFISARPFFRSAISGLKAKMIHIDLPIAIGIIAGFLISAWNTLTEGSHVYFDSICMLIFLLLIGRWFQNRGIDKARREAELLPSVLPHEVNLVTKTGIVSKYIDSVKIDDELLVSSNQITPLDGFITKGSGTLSLAFLTGESSPIKVKVGDKVFAGSKLLSGEIQVETKQLGEQTRLGKILKLVTSNHDARPKISQLTDKLSAWFTSIVLTCAAGCFLYWYNISLDAAFQNTLAFLVVACPCALGLSAPTALSVAMARAANKGIFIKGEDIVERLSNTEVLVFDKTGTLTNSEILLKEINIFDIASKDKILSVIKALEKASEHPIALAVQRKLSNIKDITIDNVTEHPGKGLSGEIDKNTWKLGSYNWLLENRVDTSQISKDSAGDTKVFLTENNKLAAGLTFQSELKKDAKDYISNLKKLGKEIKILSGDSKDAVNKIAKELEIPEENTLNSVLPEDKMNYIKKLGNTKHAMLGDGINDAAALAAAYVGIGVRGGVEASLQSADVYVSSGDIKDISLCITGANKTISLIRRNFTISILYNLIGGTLALMGLMHPLVAAVLMPISSLSVIGSSLFSRTY